MQYKSKSSATSAATRYKNERDALKEENELLKQTLENLNQGPVRRDWQMFVIGLLIGIFTLAVLGLAWDVISWAFSVVAESFEILLGLAVLALIGGMVFWLIRQLASNQDSPLTRRLKVYGRDKQESDSDQSPIRKLLERLRENIRASTSSHTKEVNS